MKGTSFAIVPGQHLAAGYFHCMICPGNSASLRAQRSNPFLRGKTLRGKMDCFVARAPRNDDVAAPCVPLACNTAGKLHDGQFAHKRHAKIARRANLSRVAAVADSPKSQASSALSRLDEEGRYGRSSRNVGAGCDGRGWRRRAHGARTNDADADGEVVWSWRSEAGAKVAGSILRTTVATKRWSPGRARYKP